MTWYLHRAVTKSPRQCCLKHNSAALWPAWLSIYITPRPSRPDSAVGSMTQHHRASMAWHLYHQHDSAALSLARLGIYIASWPSRLSSVIASMTRQHHASITRHLHHVMANSPWQCRHQHVSVAPRQHDSTSTSCHGQIVTAAPSLAWLGITVSSMTRHWCHATAWSSISTRYDFSGKQTRCQLISVLCTLMFGYRANASVLMRCLAPSWSIYVLKNHIWRL
jgi:hypothetical protein